MEELQKILAEVVESEIALVQAERDEFEADTELNNNECNYDYWWNKRNLLSRRRHEQSSIKDKFKEAIRKYAESEA